MSTTTEDATGSTTDLPEEDEAFGVNPEQWPLVILRGRSAQLAALRKIESQPIFWDQRGGKQEALLSSPISCRAQWQEEEDQETSIEASTTSPTRLEGEVFVTSSQLLFLATSGTSTDKLAVVDSYQKDVAIGATCIHLHAMTDEPEESIYLQLTEGGGREQTSELTLIPLESDGCQRLFDALCKLVSKHPLPVDEDEDDEGAGFGGGGEGFVMGDDLVWAPAPGFGRVNADYDDEDEDEGATEEERAAMLDRLDNLLVVRPEFDIQEGQFDDPMEEETETESTGK